MFDLLIGVPAAAIVGIVWLVTWPFKELHDHAGNFNRRLQKIWSGPCYTAQELKERFKK